jgi:hypothetical protein
LYGISLQKDEVISNLGMVVEGVWQWNFNWRRNLFTWEEEQYNEFLDIIAPFTPSDHDDRWLWMEDDGHGFSAKSTYLLLVAEHNPPVAHDPLMMFVFKYLWKCGVPSKVCVFAWQLLLDRIQTKDNLMKRRIIDVQQGHCVKCMMGTETALHLFLHCNYAAKIWYDVTRWLGFTIILPSNIVSSLAILLNCAKNKNEKVGLCLIWSTLVCVVWNARNNHIFNNAMATSEDLVEEVKILSWKWYISRVAKGPFLLYEWTWNPLDCMRF